ncbi:MAG: ATP phosphoribosyltransferase regulatory subunit [Isosphaeraceae bacterium]
MTNPDVAERPVDLVRGTRDWLPDECERLGALEALLLERFSRAGYEPLCTPVLESIDLHERKSGAGIVSKLFELAGAGQGVCLRPELTAGIVRAFTEAEPPPEVPWRVSHAGPVFRYGSYESPRPGPDRLREFRQVGVERLGDGGPLADAEVIWLADWALAEAGVTGATIRIGHVGLILEMLRRSGLPSALGSALIERLSEAAAEGQGVHSLETALEQLNGWLRSGEPAEIAIPEVVERSEDEAIDRLFRTLVPVVTGRRSGPEIVHRLRRKWDLSHGLLGALERVRGQVEVMAGLNGAPREVLDRLGPDAEALAPDSVASLRALLRALEGFGVDPSRVTLDLGFGRGIGFYSQVIFELVAPSPEGGSGVEVCGGGRYDGLSRVLGSDRDDRGVGFAFGLERLASALAARRRGGRPARPARGWLVIAANDAQTPEAARLAASLRALGVRALLETGPTNPPDVSTTIRARVLARGAANTVVVSDSLWWIGPEGDAPAPTSTEAVLQLARQEAPPSRGQAL